MYFLTQVYNRYHDKGLEILFVEMGSLDDAKWVRVKAEKKKAEYPILLAPFEIAVQYRVLAIPTSFLVSPDGVIVRRVQGYGRWHKEENLELLEQYLPGNSEQEESADCCSVP